MQNWLSCTCIFKGWLTALLVNVFSEDENFISNAHHITYPEILDKWMFHSFINFTCRAYARIIHRHVELISADVLIGITIIFGHKPRLNCLRRLLHSIVTLERLKLFFRHSFPFPLIILLYNYVDSSCETCRKRLSVHGLIKVKFLFSFSSHRCLYLFANFYW